MFNLKSSAHFFLFVLIFQGTLRAQTLNLLDNEELIDPGLERTVYLNLKKEKHAVKYVVEIQRAQVDQAQTFEVTEPYWEGRLPLGHYQSRFKIKFQDETESNWSEFFQFVVDHYKFKFKNLDEGVTVIDPKTKSALLRWNVVTDIKSYTLIYRQLESYLVDGIYVNMSLKKIKQAEMPKKIDNIATNEVRFKSLDPGLYEVRLIGQNAENKILGFHKQNVEFFDPEALRPHLIKPVNEFVRAVQWSSIAGFSDYRLTISRFESADGLKTVVYADILSHQNNFQIPMTWPGGLYEYCVATVIKAKTFSKEGCYSFKVKEGDRSRLAEKSHYQNLLKERQQQYFHHYNLTASTVDYRSLNPSAKSKVELRGLVLNGSYAKSNPSPYEDINTYYRLNLGILNINNKMNLTYDFRYAAEFTYFDYYPSLFKASAGFGLSKIDQAATDALMQSLTIHNHHIANTFVQVTSRYDFVDKVAVDFRLGYVKPLFELAKSNNSDFSRGDIMEYSISTLINSFHLRDKIELGYLYRSQNFKFKPEAQGFGESEVTENGHYLSIGYIAESK